MKEQTFAEYCALVHRAVLTLHRELDDPPSIAELAQSSFLSPFHFQRIFTRIAGENCRQMLRRIRLERAAWELQSTTLPISDIALRAGFGGPEPFARAFKRRFAAPATDFREARWLTHILLSPNEAHFTPSGEPHFRPMSLRGDSVPFRLEQVAPFQVAARRHHGPPHLIAKTCIEMARDLGIADDGWSGQTMISFARRLSRYMPTNQVESYAAIPAETLPEGDFVGETLGGGLHLVTRFTGTGEQLGDYWFRMWAEAVPVCGYAQAEAPCFQIVRFDGPGQTTTDIYVPLDSKSAFSVNRNTDTAS